MRKRDVSSFGFLKSAPFLVTTGLTSLIMGGLFGCIWLAHGMPNPAYMQSSFTEIVNGDSHDSSRLLLKDIKRLKRETASLMNTDLDKANKAGYSLLSYAHGIHSKVPLHRRDPFAPVAPPEDYNMMAVDGYAMVDTASPIPARVIAPTDGVAKAKAKPQHAGIKSQDSPAPKISADTAKTAPEDVATMMESPVKSYPAPRKPDFI